MSVDDHQALPARRRPVLRALAWWTSGLLLTAAALLVTAPSTSLYLSVRGTGINWPELLADALIVALCVLLALATWWLRRSRPDRAATGLAAGIGVVVAYGSSEALKVVLVQDRPCRSVVLDPDCPGVGDWSFPSNHATVAFALATAVVLVIRKWWAWSAYLAALTVAASRVVDGVHFPHDIVAGAILGTCTTAAGAVLLHRWARILMKRLSRQYSERSGALPRE